MKDNFSRNSEGYARYRPVYGRDMVEFIVSQVLDKQRAWDAATGTGQMASKLSPYFREVYATDISASQLANAVQAHDIIYTQQPAESTDFPAEHFDLVTVAQALHWLDTHAFFAEVRRVLKPSGLFAAIGYNLSQIEGMDDLLYEFYTHKVGPYWDPERRLLEDEYQSVSIPLDDLGTHAFSLVNLWTLNDLLGYLNTWSSVRHYAQAHRTNPVEEYRERFAAHWGDVGERRVVTPVFVRVARRG